MNERITGSDTVMSAIMKMAGGNPGTISVLVKMCETAPTVDPGDIMGGFGAIISLDSYGIYESEIGMLYKDVCDQNIVKVLTLLRGVQLGVLSPPQLRRAIHGDFGYGDPTMLPITFTECLRGVREICPQFAAGTEF